MPLEPAEATISLTDNSYNVCIASDRRTLAHTNHANCKADCSHHERLVRCRLRQRLGRNSQHNGDPRHSI